MDLRPTVEETFRHALAHGDPSLRVWAEVAEEVDAEGDAVWPTYQRQLTGGVVKKDLVLLFLKCFDPDVQILRGVGHVYISKDKKVEELVPLIMKKMGWGERLPPDKKILLWEVRKLIPQFGQDIFNLVLGDQADHDRGAGAKSIIKSRRLARW